MNCSGKYSGKYSVDCGRAAARRRGATDIETICKNRVHPDDRAPLRAFLNLSILREALARGQDPSLEYRRKERDGEYHWVSSTMMPIPGRKDDVLTRCAKSAT